MKNHIYRIILAVLLLVSGIISAQVTGIKDSTKVVLLGTGMPRPDPNAASPATAVVYGNRLFLFDAGSCVERQLAAAKLPINGVTALFITHLHSDHTLGYPDLIFTSWVMGRKKPMDVYGPAGLKKMTDRLIEAYSEDIEVRISGLEHQTTEGYKVKAVEIKPGLIYDSLGVRINAIAVPHGNWKENFAYRIDTPDKSILISGDTRYNEELKKHAVGIDILIHEVYSLSHLKPEKRPGGDDWPQYMKEFHTSDVELGKIASLIKPKLLILTHIIRMGASDAELLIGIKEGGFTGRAVVGHDLEIY